MRNNILGRTPEDWDICTSVRPNDIIRLFNHAIPIGVKYGTMVVVIDNDKFEVTSRKVN